MLQFCYIIGPKFNPYVNVLLIDRVLINVWSCFPPLFFLWEIELVHLITNCNPQPITE